LFKQQCVKPFTFDDPEGCGARKLSNHWISEAPAEINLLDDIIHSWLKIEGEPLLNGGRHPTTAWFDPL
jgi:hypothetical protein